MKRTFLISLFALFMYQLAFGQSSESEIKKEFYRADGIINVVLNYLPKGWKFSASGDQFLIKSPDTVWVLNENRLNAKKENKDDQIKRIREKGTRVVPEIILHYENKWTPDQIQRVKIQNAAIDDEISKLPAKYNITNLVNKSLSNKEQIIYTGTNENEKKAIGKFQNDKVELEAKKVKLPDFHSEKYSLFIISTIGNNDDLHIVYPDRPSTELYTVLSTFREVCGK